MSETQATTNNVMKLSAPIYGILDENDAYPYDVEGDNIVGISIYNGDATALSVTITDESDNSIVIPVGAGVSFESPTHVLKTIDASGSGLFNIALFGG